MKFKSFRNISIIFLLSISSCQTKDQIEKVEFAGNITEGKISDYTKNNDYLMYYFSGNCSLCYGYITTIEAALKEIPLICISSSTDTILLNEYFNKINFKGNFIVDDNYLFFKRNPLLSTNRWLYVDSKNKILVKSPDFVNDKSLNSFKEKVNNLKN
ncbi:MAG: hypothetical protein ACFHWX_18195 [Bacteroidota bacterium]